MKETKPFYLTSEFWATVALTITNVAGGLNLHGRAQGVVQAVIVGAYALARGLAKGGVPFNPDPTVPDLDNVPVTSPAEVPPDQGDAGQPRAA